MRWQDYPHLFANGKFRVKDNARNLTGTYTGIKNGQNGREIIFKGSFVCYLRHCTLIARPISDMTDEEARKIYGKSPDPDVCRKALIHKANRKILYGSEERDMTDVGVYFGPQSHFDEGTVIDGSKLEEA